MIQLYIEGKLVDVTDEFEIQLDKDFDNFDEHVVEEAHYSFEIELPITKANREALGFVDVFDVGNKFGRTYDAILFVDNVNVLKGKFMLSEIDNEYFSGNLYVPATATLKDVLGDKKLQDIKEHNLQISSWKDIDAINTNIIQNKANADRHICFPYILYRLPYNNTGSTYNITTQDLSASGSTFTIDTVFPAFNVLSVLKDAFEGEGYKLQGNVFGIEKFTELYQTISMSQEDFAATKNTPYYVSFHADYDMKRGDNISSTLVETSMFASPAMGVGTDAILLSENTKITNEVDEYNMLAKGTNTNARSLIVPKTGWYRIKCTGNMSYPVNGGVYTQDGRVNVNGCYNDSDRCDHSQNIFEFQIKKTQSPMSNCQYYSFNCATPMIPTNLSKENVTYTDTMLFNLFGMIGVKLSYDDPRNSFAKNQKTAIVRDYSGFDVSEFIAGARLGCPYVSETYSDDNLEDRRSIELALTCLPNPSKATKASYTDDGGIEHQYMQLYSTVGLKRDDDTYRADYGKSTAQALVRYDSYSNFEGYNRFKPNLNTSGGTWDTTSNFNAITYPGLENNGATASTKTTGNWKIDTVVWLEEGDMISPEIVVPWNDYADECGWLEFCDWKHFYNAGVLWTKTAFDFQMGIVSTDQKWVPTPNSPVPSFNEIRNPKPTNVNKFLGDIKVNDYIENFLNTFNLRLTKINSKTYSIDTLSTESKTYGNIIDIDEYANVKDAAFERIDTSSTLLEWTISTDEEGYVHGNTTRVNKTKRDESGYTGGIEFIDESDTADKEKKTKSNWSYTWMKDITFVNGDNSFTGGTKEVPVVGDESLWENTYLSIQDVNFATDKTSRLIYLDKNYNSKYYNFFNVYGYKNDTTIPEKKTPLIFCKNYIQYKNTLGELTTFRLDYDNTLSTKTDKTITDVYFKIKKGHQYQVNLPVTLPNQVYERIRSNTLIKFNDGLFRILGIEGHDVSGKDEATLKLISM